MIKLFRFLKPYRLPVAFALLLLFLQALADLYLPTLMSDIVDKGIVNGDTSYILKIGAFMLLVAAGSAACSIAASLLSSQIAGGFGRDLRGKVFAWVENFSLQEFDKIGTASLITRTTNDITQVQQVLTMMFRMMVSAPMMCIGGILMAVSKDPKLSLVFVVVVPLLSMAVITVARSGIKVFRAMQNKLDTINRVLREGLTGIRVVRAFNRIDYEKSRFHDANYDLTRTAVRANRIMAFLMPIMMVTLNFSILAILWFGGLRISQGDLQVGDLMAFIQYAMQIMFSMMMVSMMFVMIPRAAASAVRINEVLEMVPSITDAAQVQEPKTQRGVVVFDDVSFHYPGAEKPAIQNISFTARPGETTAIIGGTGAGKSTLISLLPRFYDVDSGRVLIDNEDVRAWPQASLRAQIGFVPQKAVLFTGTIAENIRYGDENATDEAVQKAADIAQATEFIDSLPNGFDSILAQGGTNLSGGQKQRLAIARALVRQPNIYVFDDSFSALDYKTDRLLRRALKQETTLAAVIIVAQRVSTVIDADQIIVLDEGRMAGIGTHRELLDTCDVYREIVSSQLAEEEIA